jgi:hypothetical protein
MPQWGTSVPKRSGSSDPLDVLRRIAQIPMEVSFDIDVPVHLFGELEGLESAYRYAERVNELAPRFNRTGVLLGRAVGMMNRDPNNGMLYQLAGILAAQHNDIDQAKQLLATAAELSSDPESWRLLAIASARDLDTESVLYCLLRFFRTIAPAVDLDLWSALVDLVDAQDRRVVLAELLSAPGLSAVARQQVNEVLGGQQPTLPVPVLPRPPGVRPRPVRGQPVLPSSLTRSLSPARRSAAPQPVAHTMGSTTKAQPVRVPAGRSKRHDPYVRAKYLEHRTKDLKAAKAAYREAINAGVRTESAVKDLAWLTKRTDGAQAALKVIEEEFPGIISPGGALDNIRIDFYLGARRYSEALELLYQQAQKRNTASKRNHLKHQIAYAKLSAGMPCVQEWTELQLVNADSAAVRRGLALALIQRREGDDLSHAARLIRDDADERAENIRTRIAAFEQGTGSSIDDTAWIQRILGEGRFDFTSPLVTYVMQNFSQQAETLKEQRERERKRPTFADAERLARNADSNRGRQRENSADGYISAAVIAREYGRDEEDLLRFLCAGLTALADLVLDRQAPEAARDLYREALTAADRLLEPDEMSDVDLALARYFRSLDGRHAALTSRRRERDDQLTMVEYIEQVLVSLHGQHGDAVFHLVGQLVLHTDLAGGRVIEAIHGNEILLATATEYLAGYIESKEARTFDALRAAWHRSATDRSQRYRSNLRALTHLQSLTLSDTSLAAALERLSAIEGLDVESDQDGARRLRVVLAELRQYIHERAFESREARLRETNETVRLLLADIGRAPTNFAVEGLEPVARRIESLVADATEQLMASEPQPELSLALERSSSDQLGLVTVQIKVANRRDAAPLETPELHIGDDRELFQPDESVLQIDTAVRGGTSRIVVAKLKVTEAGIRAGAFSLPVVLRYRTRGSSEPVSHDARLSIQLALDSEFSEILPNPFMEGATGRPVEVREMFYGRDDLITSIHQNLRHASSPGTGVAIFGQKRAGKSSIRYFLTKELESDSAFAVVDMENIGSLQPRREDPEGNRLLARLLWDILERADGAFAQANPDHGPRILRPDVDRAEFMASDQPVADFITVLQHYQREAPPGGPTLVILIDEFQYFDDWINRGLLSPSFMQALKALIERRMFHLIIVGQDALDRLISQHANVFGVFARKRVTYLAEQYAHLLIDEPIRIGSRTGDSRYREQAIDRILELTGGSAFYIQKFCYELVEHMNFQRAPLVTVADVEIVREKLIESLPSGDFENLETAGYTDPDVPTAEDYRAVLLAVASASPDGRSTLDEITKVYRGKSDLPELLDDLVLRDVVRRESGTYRIVVRLYQDWLLKRYAVNSASRLG